MGSSRQLRFVNPDNVAAPIGAYSHIAVVPEGAELLALAGQVGNAPDGSVPDDMVRQYENAMANIVRLLESEGAGPEHLVKINTYLVRPMDLATLAAVRTAALGSARPASTVVYVPALVKPEYLVEVEAWAMRPV